MTNCADVIAELLAQGGERGGVPFSDNVDYKGAIAWPERGSDERARLIRHIIGFTNARDGGYLLIGVDDTTKNAIGLTVDQAHSWDVSRLTEVLAQFAAPVPVVDVCQAELPGGELMVAVHIAPFQEQPSVCIQEHTTRRPGSDHERRILRVGALYVRTSGASTREVNSESMMRELLERAYLKKGDKLLQQIRELLQAHGLKPTEPELPFENQIESDMGEMGWP